jgi:hypothetical protein
LKSGSAGLKNAENVEVPGEAESEIISTSSWSCSSCDDGSVLYSLPFQDFSIIKTLLVHKEPKQLNGRLRSVFLHGRHVHIVNEES